MPQTSCSVKTAMYSPFQDDFISHIQSISSLHSIYRLKEFGYYTELSFIMCNGVSTHTHQSVLPVPIFAFANSHHTHGLHHIMCNLQLPVLTTNNELRVEISGKLDAFAVLHSEVNYVEHWLRPCMMGWRPVGHTVPAPISSKMPPSFRWMALNVTLCWRVNHTWHFLRQVCACAWVVGLCNARADMEMRLEISMANKWSQKYAHCTQHEHYLREALCKWCTHLYLWNVWKHLIDIRWMLEPWGTPVSLWG